MRFLPGQSGNPKGKPKGLGDKRTELRELFKPHASALVEKAIQMALEGDSQAMRLCMDRLVAPIKAQSLPVVLKDMNGALAEQGDAVLKALGEGRITPSEGASIQQALIAQARIVEVDELERRLTELEERIKSDRQSSLKRGSPDRLS